MHRHGSPIEVARRSRLVRNAIPALLIIAGPPAASAQVPDVGPWRCVANCGSSGSSGGSGSSAGRSSAPSPGVAANNRGNALSRAGDYAAAEQAYRDALRHRPNDGAIWYNLARVIQLQGRLEEARDAYQRGAGRDRDARRMYLSLNTYLAITEANTAFTAGSYDDAERILRAAMRIDPNATGQSRAWSSWLAEVESARQRAQLQALTDAVSAVLENGDLDEAERLVRAALARDGSNVLLQFQLYRIAHQRAIRATSLEDKLELYRRAILLNPQGHWSYIALARLLSNNSRAHEAEAFVRQAIALAPDDMDYRTRLGIILAQTNRATEAEGVYREVVARNPDHTAARTRLAELLSAGGAERQAEAYETWREVVHRSPNDGGAQRGLAAAAQRLGRRPEAEAAFRASIRLLPPEESWRSSMDLALMLGGDPEATAQSYAAAAQLFAEGEQRSGSSISSGSYFSNWALVLAAAGRAAEAVEIFERGRARFPAEAARFEEYIGSFGPSRTAERPHVAPAPAAGGLSAISPGLAQPSTAAGTPTIRGNGIAVSGTALNQLAGAAGAGERATGSGQANTQVAQEVFDRHGQRASITAPAVTVGAGGGERIPPALARNQRFVALESRRRELIEAREILETRLTQLREDRTAGRAERGTSEVAEADLKQRISNYTSQLQHVEVQRREMIRTADRSVSFDEAPTGQRPAQPARAPARTP